MTDYEADLTAKQLFSCLPFSVMLVSGAAVGSYMAEVFSTWECTTEFF